MRSLACIHGGFRCGYPHYGFGELPQVHLHQKLSIYSNVCCFSLTFFLLEKKIQGFAWPSAVYGGTYVRSRPERSPSDLNSSLKDANLTKSLTDILT
ncbi:hypothetical protein TorRG33x02_308960 [Trema orientale]|uniref:Uncharacterized protein n=1 Tax=Trema orientale TaxID=63057 RepID=A0A2P5BU14_TREOI|nr:hypothetical protein TorRG33x02_308960 [Trema orientale]